MEEIELLRRRMSSSDTGVRKAAVWQMIDCVPDEAVPVLTHALDDSAPSVRAAAAFALRKARVPDAVTALLRILANERDDRVRCTVASALALSEMPVPVDPLIVALEDTSVSVRAWACRALARHGGKAVSGILCQSLSDRAPSVRHAACVALVELGISDQRILDTLSDLERDESWLHQVQEVRKVVLTVSSQPGLEHLWPVELGDPAPESLSDLADAEQRLLDESDR